MKIIQYTKLIALYVLLTLGASYFGANYMVDATTDIKHFFSIFYIVGDISLVFASVLAAGSILLFFKYKEKFLVMMVELAFALSSLFLAVFAVIMGLLAYNQGVNMENETVFLVIGGYIACSYGVFVFGKKFYKNYLLTKSER